MTKVDLVKKVADSIGVRKSDAKVVVDIVFDTVAKALAQDEHVELRGFGSFDVRRRGSWSGRNPQTGEKVQVPAKKIPYYKPGKDMKRI